MKKVGVIGGGFVGSAIVSGFGLHSEIKVFDKDPRKSTHTLEEVVNDSEFIFVCVPTPMSDAMGGEIDTTIIEKVFSDVEVSMKSEMNPILIIKSTVTPGTVEKLQDKYPSLNIIHSPEFLTERAANLDFINASRVVLGGNKNLTDRVKGLFRDRFPYKKIIQTDVTTAQFIKYMANCFFAVKVSFMNEMKQGADSLGVNWNDAMHGFVTDGRIGNSHLDVPGHDGSLGFGGKCFPKDLNAFISLFDSKEVFPTIMRAAWTKNLEVRHTHDWTSIEGAVSNREKKNG